MNANNKQNAAKFMKSSGSISTEVVDSKEEIIRLLEQDEPALLILLQDYVSIDEPHYSYVDSASMGMRVIRFDLNFLAFYAERVGLESKRLSACSSVHYISAYSSLSLESIALIERAEQKVLDDA